jgi:hypothetical protein
MATIKEEQLRTDVRNALAKAVTAVQPAALAGKEDAFAKNTGFNKNFGTASGTVMEGNDSRVVANTAKVSNATHTGDVTGATALTIGAGKVTNAMLAGSIADGKISSASTWNGKQDALGFTPYNATNPAGYTSNVGDVTLAGVQDLTNKRIKPRVTSTASASSLTPTKVDADRYIYTALAANLTLNNPTMDIGETLVFNITDNATSRTLTFGTDYKGLDGLALPTATTISKTMEIIVSKVAATKVLVSYVNEG